MNDINLEYLHQFNHFLKENANIYANIAKNFGIPESALWTLYTIRIAETNLTQSEICNLQFESKQTVNSSLKNLEAQGFITFKPTNDKRKKLISLTPDGIKLAEKTVDKVINAEKQTFAYMNERELNIFFVIAEKYNLKLKENILNIFKEEE